MQILSASLQSFVSAGLYCCEKRRCRFYLLAKVLFQQVFNCCVKRICRFYLIDPAIPMDIAPLLGIHGSQFEVAILTVFYFSSF